MKHCFWPSNKYLILKMPKTKKIDGHVCSWTVYNRHTCLMINLVLHKIKIKSNLPEQEAQRKISVFFYSKWKTEKRKKMNWIDCINQYKATLHKNVSVVLNECFTNATFNISFKIIMAIQFSGRGTPSFCRYPPSYRKAQIFRKQ